MAADSFETTSQDKGDGKVNPVRTVELFEYVGKERVILLPLDQAGKGRGVQRVGKRGRAADTALRLGRSGTRRTVRAVEPENRVRALDVAGH